MAEGEGITPNTLTLTSTPTPSFGVGKCPAHLIASLEAQQENGTFVGNSSGKQTAVEEDFWPVAIWYS